MFDLDLVAGEYGWWGVAASVCLCEFVNWETLGEGEGSPLCFVMVPHLHLLQCWLGIASVGSQGS